MTKEKIEGGAILIARQVFESEIFMFKPAIWFKVWVYILGNVFWKDKGKLKRGQGYFKYEWIKNATGATQDQLKHCIEYLKASQMIATQKATRGMVVTVLNYDDYQDFNHYKSHTESHLKATQKPHRSHTNKEEGKEGKERKEENKGIFPEWIPQEEFEEYRKMRLKIKKPMTDRAVLLAIRELEKLKGEGHEPKQVLEQSILNSWQGLFPLRDSKPGKVDWTAWEKE